VSFHEFLHPIAGRQLEFSQVGAGSKVPGNIVPGTCLEQGMTFGLTCRQKVLPDFYCMGNVGPTARIALARSNPSMGLLAPNPRELAAPPLGIAQP